MAQDHPADFLVAVPANVIELVLSFHLQSERRDLVSGLSFAFGEAHPLANYLALRLCPLRPLGGGRGLPGKARAFNVLKGQIPPFQPRGLPGALLPPPDNDVVAQLSGIATEKAMRPKDPQIARP
jgi:hypothetical protein